MSKDVHFQPVQQRCELSTPLLRSQWKLDCELVLKEGWSMDYSALKGTEVTPL